jgi:hypothetical protein
VSSQTKTNSEIFFVFCWLSALKGVRVIITNEDEIREIFSLMLGNKQAAHHHITSNTTPQSFPNEQKNVQIELVSKHLQINHLICQKL